MQKTIHAAAKKGRAMWWYISVNCFLFLLCSGAEALTTASRLEPKRFPKVESAHFLIFFLGKMKNGNFTKNFLGICPFQSLVQRRRRRKYSILTLSFSV